MDGKKEGWKEGRKEGRKNERYKRKLGKKERNIGRKGAKVRKERKVGKN